MGAPRKQRKKYLTPSHPWQRARIEEEGILKRDYGLKNKKEIWKVHSFLKKSKEQAKSLIGGKGKQADLERKQLVKKLSKYNLLNEDAKVEEVLDLDLKAVMERRLQTIVYRQGLARTVKQARQFITHGHIIVDGSKMNVPGFLVPINTSISFIGNSALSDDMHPERVEKKVENTKIVKKKVKKRKKVVRKNVPKKK